MVDGVTPSVGADDMEVLADDDWLVSDVLEGNEVDVGVFDDAHPSAVRVDNHLPVADGRHPPRSGRIPP